MILVSLVGEQPAPNLLPARRIGPGAIVLVWTQQTLEIASRLKALLEPDYPCLLCEVDPYHLPSIVGRLACFLEDETPAGPLVFNLTSGTKPMILAAYHLAQARNCRFVYYQTEGNRSCLYWYAFAGGAATLEREEELPQTITLDDYLCLYLGSYETESPRNELEQQVADVLAATPGLEVLTSVRPQGLGALEVDFAVRLGNQVGIGEIKTSGAKAAIDQINAVAHPNYLGSYVRKFLVSARLMDRNNLNLAAAYGIEVIELPSFLGTQSVDATDGRKLAGAVQRRLGGAL